MTESLQFSNSLRQWMDVFMHRSMRSWHFFVKSTGLTMPQFSILMQLHYKGSCGMSDISEHFDISNAAASQLAEKLVQGGYIERDEDPNDRRAKQIQLTSKGRKLIEMGVNERYRWMDDLTSKLSAEEKLQVAESFKVLTEAAAQLEEKA
ncbi:MAG TPA: MarR family transcriptional regulator [Anaerolineales bacterium]|nr:hypothetical protein [Anaerolineae bacterium]HRJ55076.1 MarR family transcriptional regulator [Anaerolineales bacterium]HRK89201.1 MarR family transcriptional regulator [Anaerolineales bacterium]